jgi:hypothetical protein
MTFQYKPEILEELARHGVRPKPTSHPEFIRTVVRDLYLYEIRALRDRCRRGEFPRTELAARVIQLREKYPILSIPIYRWTG